MLKKHIFKGTPMEIGLQHGKVGKKQVIHSIETYEKLFFGYQKLSWKKAREAALVHMKAIEAHDIELIEEMEGIARGASVDFEDILALNCRTEIALGSYSNNTFSDGCTVFATMPPVGEDIIISQNWDWKGSQADSLILMEIHMAKKPVVTMITEGGLIGKIGYNNEGLGLCFNALLTDRKSDEVPIHLALRSILNSYTLSEAIHHLNNGKTAASASVIIGKADKNGSGMAINLEVSPFGIDFVGSDNGYLAHSNHIISEHLQKKLLDTNEYRFEDSMLRYKRAIQLIKMAIAKKEKIDTNLHQQWLSDTFNTPNAINHHCNPSAKEHRQTETVFSITMNLTKQDFQLCIGKPKISNFSQM